MTLLSKSYFNLLITSLLLFGINISKVMADSDDCSFFVKAANNMGDEIRNKFEKVGNCCDFFTSEITCSKDRITEM